jgi:hypothetical protein
MDIHLNKNLNTIYKEIHNSPKSSILTRKYSSKTDLLFSKWMHKYCQSYHTLFREFNPKNIKIIHHKPNTKAAKLSLSNLLKELYLEYPNLNDDMNFDKKILENLKKAVFSISNKPLGEWFNNYNQEIFDFEKCFINELFKLSQKHSVNTKIHKIINEILKALEGCNKFMSFGINEELKHGLSYLYTYKDNELKFKVHSNKNIPLDNIYWRFLYARMKSIPRTYDVSSITPKMITFEIFLSDQKKLLPRKGAIFGPQQVNSGCTDYQTITIWRKEEHFKLILHESIHFYNLDGSFDLSHQNDNITMECNYQIGDKNETRIYEAYTESLTVFLNSFANAYQIYYLENPQITNLTILNEKDLNNITKIRYDLWNLERRFALMQISKIFININPESNDFKDFLVNPDNCSSDRSNMTNKLNQRTSVLSYHILKGANIFFDIEFIEWLHDLFNPHPKSLYKFFEYITVKTHKSEFINAVNQMIKYMKGLNNYNKNLRMTFYETDLELDL